MTEPVDPTYTVLSPSDTMNAYATAPGAFTMPGMGAGSYGSMFAPPMQDPSFRRYALNNALIDAGLGLVQASAPSRVPQNWGSMFGALAAGAGQGAKSAQEDYYKRQMMAGQVAMQRFQMGMMGQQMGLLNGLANGGGDSSQPQQAAPTADTTQTASGPNPNNIGNVRPEGATKGFQQPATFDDGVALAVRNAQAYQKAAGTPLSLNEIAAKWAPKGDGNNDPAAWAANVAKIGGLDPNQPIDMSNPQTAMQFARGVHGAEWGADKVQAPGSYLAGVNKGFSGQPLQFAQAQGGGGGTADAFPTPPQITPRQKIMLMSPMLKPLAEAEIANQQKQYEGAKAAYEAKQKLRATAREEANADVLPNGQPNQAKLAAEGEKKRQETEAQETARENALFGGKGWQSKSADDLRKSVNPELLAVTESVQAGRTPMSNVNQSRAANGISFSKNEVNALGEKLYGEQWDPNGGDRRQKFENDTTDTSSQTGKTLYSINTVYKHINRYQELTDAIQSHNTPLVNQIMKAYNDASGNAKYTTPEALQHALGTEIAAVIKGQQLNEPEVESAIDTIKTTKSPEQMHGALGVLRHAMGDRESTIAWAARRAKVPESRIQGLIDPDARAAINKFDSDQAAFAQAHEQKTAPAPALTGAISLDAINAEIARRQKGAQ